MWIIVVLRHLFFNASVMKWLLLKLMFLNKWIYMHLIHEKFICWFDVVSVDVHLFGLKLSVELLFCKLEFSLGSNWYRTGISKFRKRSFYLTEQGPLTVCPEAWCVRDLLSPPPKTPYFPFLLVPMLSHS